MDHEAYMDLVERHRREILEAERELWARPETGFREWFAHKYMSERLKDAGYELTEAGNIPGFYTVLDTGRPGPTVLILAELDSLLCATHPEADPSTGAVHACGHHAQMAAILGLALALREPGALDGLSGRLKLCLVPAEELIETGWREELRQKGVIKYYGGKVEFLYRGYFDDVDMAFMMHTSGRGVFGYNRGSNGCVVKNITYLGKASHAGGSPDLGVNALYAANLGMQAVNALRETFRDGEHIRFHPIVTAGGAAVNAIPDKVTMESYVRGATVEAIVRENRKINRALAGAAAAMGANVRLCDRPGYTPLINDPTLLEVARRAMTAIAGEKNVWEGDWSTGCTDMGDLSAVMPAIHPYVGGAEGAGHGADYRIADPVMACVTSAKCQLLTARMLLENDAAEAKRVIAASKPRFASKADYFAVMDALTLDRDAVRKNDDGTLTLDYSN